MAKKIVFTKEQWITFEKLCGVQCTKLEICEYYRISEKTLDRLVKSNYGKTFSLVFAEKRTIGLISLRRSNFRLADKHPAMAIFMSKNYLGMKDKQEFEHLITDKDKARKAVEEIFE